MNAIIREEYEARVLTNDAIEVHLTYLRTGFDSMQAALPVLRGKIETVDAKLTAKIDAVDRKLSEKIDEANKQRGAGDAALGDKIDKLTERVLEVQGHQKAVLWVFSISSIVAAVVSVARTLSWI